MQPIGDRKLKFQSLTRFIIDLQTPAKSFALIFVMGLVSGAAAFAAMAGFSQSSLAAGVVLGLWLVVLPGIGAAAATTIVSELFGKKLLLRRSAYLAFFSTIIIAALFAVGGLLPTRLFGVVDLYLYSLVIVFAVRAFTLKIACSYSSGEAVVLSALHPAVCLAALLVLPLSLPLQATALKLLSAGVITAAGVTFFIVLLNAPMKRNFGLNAFELANAFLTNWIDKTRTIEQVFEKMSEKADTQATLLAFKTDSGLKTVYVVPSLHAGPFGDVGGGRLVRIFEQKIGDGAVTFVMHGAATHDLNPVSSSQLEKAAEKLNDELKKIHFHSNASLPVRTADGSAKVLGQKFGDSLLAVSTFSPQVTEDIDSSVGLALENTLEKNRATAAWVDAHNCYYPGDHTIYSGNPKVFSLLGAAEKLCKKLDKASSHRLRQGVSIDELEEFSAEQGVGETGLRVSVIETGRVRTAHVCFDANNMAKGLREKIIRAVKHAGIDEVEVLTTDSHSVNNVRGVQNPLGWKVSQKTLIRRAVQATQRAVEDLEPVQVGAAKIKIRDIKVLGSQRTAELVSTINSTIAVMKIMTPAVFFTTILASVISILAVPWA